MIPLRLSIRNFMCYREPPVLDFEPIRVACLCGQNGHGKSALLDAITWALWGEARARTQDELIHQGQTDMSVELDFSARDRRYRVSRRHSKKRGKQGATILELQVASNGGYVPITGNTVRETEAAIRDLLHMDYDTFVNTAFLLQGRADMFTAATPSKRKEVLAEVLDLGYYETLTTRAREKGRERERRIAVIDATVEAHSAEITRAPGYRDELAGAEKRLAEHDDALKPARAAAEALRTVVDRLTARRSDLASIDRRLATARTDLDALGHRAQSHRSRLAELEGLVERSTEIEGRFADLAAAKSESDSLASSLASLNELERERAEVERELAVRRERLTGELDRERSRLAEMRTTADRLPAITAAVAALVKERAAVDRLERQGEEERAELHRLQGRAQVLESEANGLRAQMEATRKRFDLLESGDAACPVCGQSLAEEGADHLRSEYEREGTHAKARHGENRAEAEEISGPVRNLTKSLADIVAQVARATQDVQLRTLESERDLATSTQAQAGLEEGRRKVAALEKTLALPDLGDGGDAGIGGGIGEGLGRNLTRKLAEIDARMGELGYDPNAHQGARARVAELEPYADLYSRLQRAAVAVPEEREALEATVGMAERRTREVADDERAAESLRADLEGLPAKEAELATVSDSVADLDRRRTALAGDIGGLRERIARCLRLEAEVAGNLDRRRVEAEKKSVYDELAGAFGKNGIQALIIETAIPQIETGASELLGRLTDGRMSLRMDLTEGRRDHRLGMHAEQLDIRIADEMGTRSYETFSGGEAFRINFAIRIALSRLLAGRSGAPLPVLFIDEGFGSQDAAGQDRLREAIHSIQDEFQKILVITHIESVKDTFPVRIEVEKTPSGSTFTVV